MKKFLLLIGGLLGLGWLGLITKPKPLPKYEAETVPMDTIRLPDNLPEPVYKFYETIIGDEIPVICSAVITGQGIFRLGGIPFNGRFRFTHRAGYDYRHYLDLTCFGQPFVTINETYRDGKAHMKLPFGTVDDVPEINFSANQTLWGEAVWFPTIYLTDRRVCWEAIDATHARLVVPEPHADGDQYQDFRVTFHPDSHLIQRMETMRYREPNEPKICWILDMCDWKRYHGMLLPMTSLVTWEDQDYPWFTVMVDDIVLNADISDYIMASGI